MNEINRCRNIKLIETTCFREGLEYKGKKRVKDVPLRIGYELSWILECYGSKTEYGYGYVLRLISHDRENRSLLFFSATQEPEFEAQFPVFPYYREDFIFSTLDKKMNMLEQQNIALLSHLETIMIALRLRAVDDDNLEFT